MRGHGSLLGAVDLIVRTGRHEDGVLVEADKANGLSEKPRRAFRFESVDLECYDGATTSAPVLMPRAVQPKQPGTRQKLTDRQTLALRALREIASDKAPASLEAWHQELISRNVADEDHRGRQTFERVQGALLTRNMIGRRDGRAWPLG
jgi:hypothetical protein